MALTPAERTALLAEIGSGPLAAQLAPLMANANDWAVADLLNTPTERGPVPIVELSAYCTVNGITGGVEAVANTSTAPTELRGLCHTVLSLIRDDYRLTTADVDTVAFGAGCDGLIESGLMTSDQKTAILALAANRRGRGEIAIGRPVTPADIGECR